MHVCIIAGLFFYTFKLVVEKNYLAEKCLIKQIQETQQYRNYSNLTCG